MIDLHSVIEGVRALGQWEGKEGWQAFTQIRRAATEALETNATGQLKSFEISPLKRVAKDVQSYSLIAKSSAPMSVAMMARELWRWIGGEESPERALHVLTAAAVEFTRSQLDDTLVGISFDADGSWFPVTEEARSLLSQLKFTALQRPWSHADAIVRSPTASVWFNQSAAFDFNEWLASTAPNDERSLAFQTRLPASAVNPPPDPEELLFAIALTWIDEALQGNPEALNLVSEAADAMGCGRFLQGWNGHEEMVREQSRSGAALRHTRHREYKQQTIEAYLAGNFPSKDAAAFALAGKVIPLSFRAVRDYLKGVEPPAP